MTFMLLDSMSTNLHFCKTTILYTRQQQQQQKHIHFQGKIFT